MTSQLGLFDPPAQRHSATSVSAAEEIKPAASILRGLVLAHVASCGAHGATDEEIQASLSMNPSTQRPRRIELVQAGRVANSGMTRKTSSGRLATVWVAT